MNTEKVVIEFVLNGKVLGEPITPSSIGLSRFNAYNLQIEEFIAGQKGGKVDEVQISILPGSYKLQTLLPLALAVTMQPDLDLLLQRQDSLGDIDPKRAQILSQWQARSKRDGLIYAININGSSRTILIDQRSNFRVSRDSPWMQVEKYFIGTVVDMGGARKANVHLRLKDSKEILHIETHQQYLMDHSNDRLYKDAMVRVSAEQHAVSGQFRNLQLLSFEDYQPSCDDDEMRRFVEAGTKAWADVPDAAEWVSQLRGGEE